MRILVSDSIAKEGVELLKTAGEVNATELTPEELLAQIGEYDALVVRSRTKVTKEVIEKAANLKVIGRAGIGVDNIDVKTATAKGIVVVNAPRSSTTSVAELAIGHMLSIARSLPRADRGIREGKWEKKQLKGAELFGKTLGFIGSGRIGAEVAVRARAFGMKTLAYDPYLSPDAAKNAGVELCNLDRILKESDFVTIHAMLTDETRGMVGVAEFAKMKPTAYIVNCARGGIIDETALYNALKDKKIAGAALDVFAKEPLVDSPLVKLDNIVFTPHIGASTKEGQERAGMQVAEQVIKAITKTKPDSMVNPEAWK
ncbi:MAG: hydroxyacid dehydrogenase [Methanobacteriota archaeon]